MPDMKGFDTPFKDYVADKMPFTIAPTLDTPTSPINSSDSGVTGSVTPKELPDNELFHG